MMPGGDDSWRFGPSTIDVDQTPAAPDHGWRIYQDGPGTYEADWSTVNLEPTSRLSL